MYQTFLQICRDIIVIGGAFIVIISFVAMIVGVVIMVRINRTVGEVRETVAMVRHTLGIPFAYIMHWIEKKKTKKTKKTTNN